MSFKTVLFEQARQAIKKIRKQFQSESDQLRWSFIDLILTKNIA